MSEAFGAAAASLAIDAQTARVVTALRAAGVDPILLKGPAVAAWLYRDGRLRPYGDTDLLVAAAEQPEAARVLSALGYVENPTLRTFPTPATAWLHATSSLELDLHTRLWSWGDSDQVWRVLQAHTQPLRVAGVEVRVLDDAAKAVHVVTHALQHMYEGEKWNEDLDRALVLVDDGTWAAAARLAGEVGAAEAFAVGLHAHPGGAALCERLGIAAPRDLELQYRYSLAGTRYVGVQHLDAFVEARGLRARAAVLRDRVLPPLAYARSKVGGAAGRDRVWTYVRYWVWIAGKAPATLRAWLAARR